MMFSRLIELNDTSNSTSTNKLPPTEKQSSSEPNTVEITSISNKSNEEDHEDSGKAESKLEEKPSLKTDSNKRPSSAKRYTDNHEDYREFGNSEGEFQFSTESSSDDGFSDDLMLTDSDWEVLATKDFFLKRRSSVNTYEVLDLGDKIDDGLVLSEL